MIFTHTEHDDGDLSLTLDDEGIDYLIEGLELLRNADPGGTVDSPVIGEDGVSSFLLVKA